MRHNTQHSLLHRRRHVADAAAASAPQHALRAIFILLVVVMGSCLVVDALEEATSSSPLQDVYELVPRYAINPTSMILLLHDDGRLAAHDARDGTHMWSTHLRGGAMTKVVIDQAPTNATFFDDPFSVPFIVNGDGLYTHRPWKKISGIYDDVGELHAHPQQLPSSANNNNITAAIHALREACFFMPLSALRRRELVQVGATDIYVTTSATIIDIDSSTGARLHPHGSTTSTRRRWGPSTREGFTTTNIQEFDVDDVVEDDDAHDDERASIMYVPFHAVRYNAHIRAVKRGAYDWTITISQLRIAPRHAAMSAERDELARSNRFFSQVLRSDFAFDEESSSSSSSTKGDASAQEVYVIEEINATHAALVRSMGNVRHLMWSVPITCVDGTSTTAPTTSKDQPRCKHTVQDELFLPEGHRITSAFAWLRHNNAVVRLRVDRHRSLDERLRTALTDFAVAGGALHTRVLHMGHALDYYAPPLGDGGGEGTSSSSSSSRGDVVAPTYYNDDVDLFAEDFEGNELEKYFRRGLLPDDALYPMDGDDQHHLFHDNNVFMDADVVVVERGITWRTAVAAGIHIACFACSVGLLCAGIPPRSRLQRAWAQADRGLRGQVVSRPTSTKLLPSDPLLVAQSTNTEDSDAYGHAMMLHGDADAGVERGALSHGSSSIDVFSRHLQASPPPWPMLDDDVATNTSSPPPYQQQQRGSLTRDESDEDEGTEWWRRARTSASMSDETEGELCPSPELRLFEQEFKVMKKIGSGAEGAVYCVEHHTTRAKYAIKVVRVDRQDEQRAIREAILHSSLYHPQVVRYFFSWTETLSRAVAQNLQLLELGDGLDGFSTSYRDHSDSMATSSYPSSSNMDDDDEDDDDDDDDQPYRMLFIQMEYYPCGTFADLLRERKRIDRVDNLRALREIAGGLEYVHGQDVIHRDLKPSNIFVSSAATKGLKIGDFGLAKRRGAKLTESALPSDVAGGTSTMNSVAGGTPLYASPELRRGDDVGKPSDIYSLAIIGVEMYAIFRTMHERILVLTEVRGGRYPPDMMEAYPEEVKLFSEMLQESPASRPSIRQVMARLKEIFLLERERNNAS